MSSVMFLVLFTVIPLFCMFDDGDTPSTKREFLQWTVKESKRLERIRKQNIVSVFEKKTYFFCKKIIHYCDVFHDIMKNNKDPKDLHAKIIEHEQLLSRIYAHLEQSYLRDCELINKKLILTIKDCWMFYKQGIEEYDKYRTFYFNAPPKINDL